MNGSAPTTQFVRSLMRYSWALTLLGIKEVGTFFTSGAAASGTASRSSFSGTSATDASPLPAQVQTAPEDPTQASISIASVRSSTGAASRGRLNTARFIVLGEGLAAGMGDFSVNSEGQRSSFPAVIARQMNTEFKQSLFQAPGIGGLASFPERSILIPAPLQSTVLENLPPGPVSNLSVPGFTLSDALELRPTQPLIHRHDAKQTAVNLTWGALAIAQGRINSLPIQLEYALQQNPTFTIVELGYYEAIAAAVYGKPALVGDPGSRSSQYEKIFRALKDAGSEVLALTIPDPLDTAHFSSLTAAAGVLKVTPDFLLASYELAAGDQLTVNGLNEIGFQIFGRSIEPLTAACLVKAEVATEISARLGAVNEKLVALAKELNVPVFDLSGLFRRIKENGILIGSRRLNAEYLGGFYSLNGLYPGATGQAVIANEILQTLNREYDADFATVDLSSVVADDPVAAYRQAAGPVWNSADLRKRIDEYRTPESPVPAAITESRSQKATNNVWKLIEPAEDTPPQPLRLPPGLVQELPLNKELSYFGDGISAINARTPRSIQWGSSGNFMFGGLAMVDSHLSGTIRIQFSPPENGLSHFEVSFADGFSGDDAVLVTPQFFKMAFQQNRVEAVPGAVSSGTLNLQTGEVTNLSIFASYRSTALAALIAMNPAFPRQINFPGQYGSARAQFEQRADGKLDFTFYGSTFGPLGKDILWPLNFVGPSGQFATVPANGTVMHPHLSLSTREVSREDSPGGVPDIPYNTIQEFTLYTHNSSFGDAFHLNVPAVGGPAKGRSELLGRLQIQFGERTGNSVPFAVWALAPGGIMAELPDSPITEAFPGRLWAGPQGFNENLRFPQRTYPLDDLSILGDPFDICVGALDLRSGRSINDMLHRAFISQDLIFALLRVEPRTPKDSFFFRGPAWLQKDAHGGLVFRFQGIVGIPYPEGFRFPRPDFATGFVVGPDSRLDPFLWFHALQDTKLQVPAMEGFARHVRASTGDEFSYQYRIPEDPTDESAMFEYVNHTQNGHFRLHSLAWVGFSDSRSSSSGTNGCDTVTFSGFGVWSNGGVHTLQQAAVQISTSQEKPYVGIQIASGDISNVNTKPENEMDALP